MFNTYTEFLATTLLLAYGSCYLVNGLESRDTDYGSETITASFAGTTTTFTHIAQATVSADDAGNLAIKLADPLASAFREVGLKDGICEAKVKRTSSRSESRLKKRVPPILEQRLAVDDRITRVSFFFPPPKHTLGMGIRAFKKATHLPLSSSYNS